MTVAEIEAKIAVLIVARDAAKKIESQSAREAAAAFVMTYDWEVTWPHPAKFRVARKVTAECAARLQAFIDAHGSDLAPKPFEGGMTYSLLEGGYVEGGGGSVIVQFGDADGYRSSFDPEPIGQDVLVPLRNGIVPDSIKRP